MEKELVRDFAVRVAGASKTELIVIMYDVILADLASARKAEAEKDFETFEKEMEHAKKFVVELIGCLNLEYAISYELLNLYRFAHKQLVRAGLRRNSETLDSVEEIIGGLRASFHTLSKSDASGPVMQNAQQLYAGLTYSKGSLNESMIDPYVTSRGYTI
ncbi:MAG: flagellar protein FliS [Lachnospiraceae bacterium]|nr:flagellar protein FliS [Lachnospiraceae bacterium]